MKWLDYVTSPEGQASWGGYKKSRIGRELGVYGLEEYQEVKQVNINLDSTSQVGWYEH